jgi:hypothetical protein
MVLLAQCHHVVNAFAADGANQSFGKTILPRRSSGNRLVADAHGPQSAPNKGTEDPVAITDQIAWRLVPGECFGNLLRDPFGRRVGRHIDPDKLSPRQPDHDKSIEQVKSDGWHDEQIHGGNLWRVIADKGAPTLTGRVTLPGHIFGYGRL